MKKPSRDKKEPAAYLPAEPDLAGLLNKIQQQLVFLEKKIDTLINNSSSRPAELKPFPKPFRQPGYSRNNRQARQDNDYRERALHRAVCASCRKECEVPFKPSGDRPIYCRECFSKRKTGDSFKERPDDRPRRREAYGKESYFSKKQYGRQPGYSGKKNFRKRRP